MAKSAFLIIAHNEFEILQLLVKNLDNADVDIFIHVDAKVSATPQISSQYSKVFFTEKRIDVRWGHVSQLDCEYTLWEEAHKHGPYDFYHLISGVHMPLKPINEILKFYSDYTGKSVIEPFLTKGYEKSFKVNCYNFCVAGLNYGSSFTRAASQLIWKTGLRVQRMLGYSINNNIHFKKSSNWVSLSEEAVEHMLMNKKQIRKRYRYSFCGDEYFVWTELATYELKDKIVEKENILRCEFVKANPRIYRLSDIPELESSGFLFARKFSIKQP